MYTDFLNHFFVVRTRNLGRISQWTTR